MSLIVNYSNYITENPTTLKIEDTSTVNYDDENIISRKIYITFSSGTIEEFNFPIVNGVGDIFEYNISKDLAIKLDLELTPSVAVEDSEYFKSKNLLIANKLAKCIKNKRLKLHYTKNCKCIQSDFVQRISYYYDTAVNLISSDIYGAQESLDSGIKLCKCNCGCK